MGFGKTFFFRPTIAPWFLCSLFLPFSTPAAGEQAEARFLRPVSLPVGEVLDRDYFAFGPLVEISGTVNGDVYAMGGQILIDGRVNGDVLIAGGRVTISGQVAQDVRAAGGQVSVSGSVGRNVAVLGGNVDLTGAAEIKGSLVSGGGNVHLAAPLGGGAKVAAGSLIISNRVGGDVDAAVGLFRITSNAEIAGNVDYVSQSEASVDQGARIGGKLTRTLPPKIPRPSPGKVIAFFAGWAAFMAFVSFVSTLILGLLSLRFLPRYHASTVAILRERPWASLGIGFIAAVVTPVVCVILFATVFAIPLALIFTGAYLILLYWGRIFAINRLGEAIFGLFRSTPRQGWAFTLGLVVYFLVALIPFIGWIVVLLVVLSGLGAELIARKDFYVVAKRQEMI